MESLNADQDDEPDVTRGLFVVLDGMDVAAMCVSLQAIRGISS
jgi:hypothetical protein